MTVSFDFDGTLNTVEGLVYAVELISRGFNVLITTQRPPTMHRDVFVLAKKIGIPIENIIFCGINSKKYYLEDRDYIFHLDDKLPDVPREILFDKSFRYKCEKAINEYKEV